MPIINKKLEKMAFAMGVAIIAVVWVRNCEEMKATTKVEKPAHLKTVESISIDTVDVRLATPPPTPVK